MIDWNGWIQISIDSEVENDIKADYDTFFENIKPVIVKFNSYDNQFVELKKMNGLRVYHLGGAHNHSLTYLNELIELYKTIGKKAPGSFGILYVRLPEDEKQWNEYLVFKLAKGIVTEHKDYLLSPCNPVIED